MKQNENYEKKYKDALDRASHIKDYNTIGTPQEIAELIFPELRESEDERIRKEIISALKFANDGGVYDKHIAYLEKQKEQKPVEWAKAMRRVCKAAEPIEKAYQTMIDKLNKIKCNMTQTLEQVAEASALKKYPSFTAENYDLVKAIRKAYTIGFKAGAKWQKKRVSEYLDKWMEHATRGSEKGNNIYHLGKIDLILAIQEWLKEEDEK